ncbi:PA3371 family protein [Pseudomonas violetae]|jgi:hypothetical protein|uniref:Uncharacterized protein n=1 Tax=Pseudomonas violetae TaxID=2915813 RepID=A0ABT0F1S9_9PSED|nr:PA3371 family protein [Pseudomonas violetae]MCK1791622.1 hypothetical protein [Pseudomonas violetae]
MSKWATGFFALSLMSGMLHVALVKDALVTAPLIVCAASGFLFMGALIAGRKIKFDPVLR